MARINVYDAGDGYTGRKLAGWFNSSKAREFKGGRRWDGDNMVDINVGSYTFQSLLRTAKGRWVLETLSQWQGVATTHKFVDDAKAREWLIRNAYDDEVEEYFGELEEETGPGRPEIGPAIHTRLRQEQLDAVDGLVGTLGAKRADVLRALLDRGLAAHAAAQGADADAAPVVA